MTGVDTPIAGTPPADQQLSGVRGATPLFEVFRGVAVTATNRDGILVIAVGRGRLERALDAGLRRRPTSR